MTPLDDRSKLKLFSADHRPLASTRLESLADSDRLAAALIEVLPARCVIGMVGTLGSGKTRLTQALAVAAGVPAGEVTSPTFTLVHRYRAHGGQGERLLYHIDAYRVVDEDEFWELGIDEMFQDQALTVIEWADRISAELPAETLWLHISLSEDGKSRTVRLAGRPDLWSDVLRQVPMLCSTT